jgi:hypothetical protein
MEWRRKEDEWRLESPLSSPFPFFLLPSSFFLLPSKALYTISCLLSD